MYPLSISGTEVTLSVLNGSMKCVDNGEPVAPSMERLRSAVSAKRVVPFSRAAFTGWPSVPTAKVDQLPTPYTEDYKPGRIYGRANAYNSIGVVSGQGGEYASSRSFISGDDAALVAAAVDGDATLFAKASTRNRAQMLWGLSLPNLAIWSPNNNMLRDPQVPFSGEKGYANEGTLSTVDHFNEEGEWCAPAGYAYLSEIGATAGTCYPHNRDEAHLFNHGYAYWLATGDPRAAILQQAIAAYALAGVWQGAYSGGDYRSQFEYQRMTLNVFSALWKARDVALNASGPMLWSKDRVLKMADDVAADYATKIDAMDAADTSVLVWNSVAELRMMSAFKAYDTTVAFSKFMSQIYGPETAYLWASAGKGRLLTRLAENMIIRLGSVGGSRGLDNGASTLLTMDGSATSLSSVLSSFATRTQFPTANFNGSETVVALRAYWLLRMAKDAVTRGWIAPIAGLDDAIAKTEAARAATTNWIWSDISDWKHSGTNF